LDKSITKMQELANGKIDNFEELKAIVEAAVKIFKAVDEVQKIANSDETKTMAKNIQDLLDSVR
jgi:hypothetical protein